MGITNTQMNNPGKNKISKAILWAIKNGKAQPEKQVFARNGHDEKFFLRQ